MAFTSTEKRQIRTYLGYSGGFRDRGVRLESMMTVVGEQLDEAAYARELLTQIAAVDAAIVESGSSSGASTYGSVKKVDEVEFHSIKDSNGATTTILTGVALGEVLIERLRALFDVPLNSRYFQATRQGNQPFPLG